MKLSKVMTMSHVLTMAMCAVVFGLSLSAQASPEAAAEASEAVAKAPVTDMVAMSKNLAIALTMGCGSFAAALAVGKIGVAAMGAAASDPQGKPVALMNKDDKVKAIQFLNQNGAFLVTKSGDKIAKYFGISKYTLYSYIDKQQEEK